MTLTLLKHEFIRTRVLLAIIIGGALAASALGTLLMWINVPVVSQFGPPLIVLPIVALVPATQIALAIDFWRSGFRSGGYLTHSLPVKGATIFWTKLLHMMLATAVVLIIGFLLFWAAWFTFASSPTAAGWGPEEPNLFVVLGSGLEAISDFISLPLLLGVYLPIVVLFMFFTWPVMYAFIASVGSEGPFGRMGIGGLALMGVITYVGSQAITFLATLATPLGFDFNAVSDEGTPQLVVINTLEIAFADGDSAIMPLGVLVGTILTLVIVMWRTHRSWNRHVSLN
ncbi:hypothetical protein [Auritidibacter ignavus]|uniref:hypothetical protein n=1 Tax=Auritidibacter ignavus TaxID=678932 RepID=UPI002448AF76|nr:hypothetical protein [Auritidibacter ignavus]WGH83356.1 hypothetical protein QDX20_08770 [Auritidibacter ignavus]